MMTRLLLMERRLVDLETKLANLQRQGRVKEVKYDEKRKRWYAKVSDTTDENDPNAFQTGWLPWASFGHGTISMSVPPRVGQLVSVQAPNGQPEMAFLVPYHHTPENPAPHDKEDEVFLRVNKPREDGQDDSDPQETLIIHMTKDKLKVVLGDTTLEQNKGALTITTKTATVNASEKAIVNAPAVALGGEGGPPVARVGDLVHVSFGSSEGMHQIVSGSSVVSAVD